jgi:hypothetical protein
MATQVNGDTVITMTMKQLLGAVASGTVLFGGALWVVMTFTLGNLQNDVSDIRKAVTDTQDRNADTLQSATSADTDLRAQLAGLTAELKVTNAGLTNLTNSVAGLDESMRSVDARLAASVARQESFERYVAVRLGPIGTQPTGFEIPVEWQKQQDAIAPTLTTGENPFIDWYKSLSKQ